MNKRKIIGASLALAMALSTALSNGNVFGAQNKVDSILEGMTVDQKITHMLMPDFRQWKQTGEEKATDLTVLNDEVANIIDTYDFGGVILFANNVKETEQTLKLTCDMQNAAITNQAANGNVPLLITIDQEGGIVYRLGSGTALPGNMALGAANDVDAANDVGEVVGRELNALGINVNFAPVFDTNNNPNNPVIGLRSISSDPEMVAKLGVPMMKGMQKHNVATAAKHFPGHGDTATDSHTGLPLVDKSYEELAALELVPFQAAVDNGVDMLMTAHIQYPQIEKDTVVSKADGSEVYVPATLSDDIITGIVREKMNYDGIVITDAMNMDAIAKNFGEAEAVIMAMKADVDICLMPTILRSTADIAKLDNIIAEVKKAIDTGELSIDQLDNSVRRILELKEQRGILSYAEDNRTWEEKLANANEQVGSDENRAIEREVSAKAVTVTKNENNMLPLKPKAGEKVLLLGAYNNELPGMEFSMRRLIDENIVSNKVEYESVRYSSGTTLDSLKDKIDSANYVVVISEIGSAAQMKQTHWLTRVPTEIINYASDKTVIMSISKPYDVANYPAAQAIVAVYGAKGMDPTEGLKPDNAFGPNIPAGIEVIFGGHAATGKLPVDINKFNGESYTEEIVYPLGYGLTYDALKVEMTDKTALEIAVEMAEKVDTTNVVPAVVVEFEAALAQAKDVLAHNLASQVDVDLAFTRLADVMHMLEFVKGDKTDLQNLVTQIKKLNKDDYTTSSWDKVVAALNEAEKILIDENAMQKEINEAYDKLFEAFTNLVVRANKDALQQLVDKVNDLDTDKYIPETLDKLLPVAQNAQAVLDNNDATQDEVNKAYEALLRAYLDLRLKPNKDLLNDLINKAEALDTALYTTESYMVLNNAVIEAKAVLTDPNADEEAVNVAIANLEAGFAGLKAEVIEEQTDKPEAVESDDLVSAKSNTISTGVKTGDKTPLAAGLATMLLAGISYVLVRKNKKD